MGSKKRRKLEPPTIHPRNRYAENPPDFRLLASLYPSFEPFVFYSRDGRPRIDWTDFNATRELTRILLHHHHSINWWIPDGQLCPTVPNRSNYIHWIEDLLSSDVIPKIDGGGVRVRGFDIGTGANCIYPLLGASLLGWNFVGSDVTDVALEWAEKNVGNNPHLSELIEIRKAVDQSFSDGVTSDLGEIVSVVPGIEEESDKDGSVVVEVDALSDGKKSYQGPPVLIGVVRDGEKFDFCMCNPPFFESIAEAGLNPKTSCGGTFEEMVCPGGEQAFITQIIEDSVKLKQSFRWYTTMVGRKANLKVLVPKLREVGVSIVKTTEFVQGQTSRWGLAWSFLAPTKKIIASHVSEKNHQTFMLEGLQRQFGAMQVLKSVEFFFLASGASCKSNLSSFIIDITASNEQCEAVLKDGLQICDGSAGQFICETSNVSSNLHRQSDELCFRVSVFEQIPGTLLLRGSLLHKQSPLSVQTSAATLGVAVTCQSDWS
ncbi:methyltransferase isoform X2 [Tasmannia lanceolata]|uniref:methyltransferase isoform X2 n=1 Tax=Tasmannia lanceolata TaxID=3420 RepID=UPI004062A994